MRAPYKLGMGAAILAAAQGFSGCTHTTGSTGGGGGGTTSTSSVASCSDASISTAGCSIVLSPSSNDTSTVQTALIEVKSGGTVCLCPGTFKLNQQLTLTVPNVTLQGLGATFDDSLLDFSAVPSGGNDTMLVTADHFTAQNFAVTNTPGNGVVVRQSDSPTFRNLHVTWTNPDLTKHGAYAVYPAECTNVLVEDCEVSGAADAAVYVGQGNGAILRHNKCHDSVLGLELENTTNGEAYDNEAYNNSGGMAVFLLGNLTKKSAAGNLVHDNNIHDNNGMNFGNPNSVVSGVPTGTGIIVVGTSGTEIRNNTITNNESVGVLVVSYTLMTVLIKGATMDPSTPPYPDHIFIHGNTYTNNGTNPQAPFNLLGVSTTENVLWDGWVASGMPAANDIHFCLGSMSPWPTFRMFDGQHLAGTPMPSTDSTPYHCDLPEIMGNPP